MKLIRNEVEKVDFAAIKKASTRTLSSRVINPEWPFVLCMDASNFAVGAILEKVPLV